MALFDYSKLLCVIEWSELNSLNTCNKPKRKSHTVASLSKVEFLEPKKDQVLVVKKKNKKQAKHHFSHGPSLSIILKI